MSLLSCWLYALIGINLIVLTCYLICLLIQKLQETLKLDKKDLVELAWRHNYTCGAALEAQPWLQGWLQDNFLPTILSVFIWFLCYIPFWNQKPNKSHWQLEWECKWEWNVNGRRMKGEWKENERRMKGEWKENVLWIKGECDVNKQCEWKIWMKCEWKIR